MIVGKGWRAIFAYSWTRPVDPARGPKLLDPGGGPVSWIETHGPVSWNRLVDPARGLKFLDPVLLIKNKPKRIETNRIEIKTDRNELNQSTMIRHEPKMFKTWRNDPNQTGRRSSVVCEDGTPHNTNPLENNRNKLK